MGGVFILILSRGREGILKIAYNPLKLLQDGVLVGIICRLAITIEWLEVVGLEVKNLRTSLISMPLGLHCMGQSRQ